MYIVGILYNHHMVLQQGDEKNNMHNVQSKQSWIFAVFVGITKFCQLKHTCSVNASEISDFHTSSYPIMW